MLALPLLFAAFLSPAPPPTDWRTPFEKGDGNTTATHAECIGYYRQLAAAYPAEASLREFGATDGGAPLHEVVLGSGGALTPDAARRLNRRVVFIQNGIHPGEPEGIDASLMLARDLLREKKQHPFLDNVTVVLVPVYNVDGMLSRGPSSRVNQNGPANYGFRANARNLDLNRDYVKQDSRNARAFAALFQQWRPDLYIETHTSNGADYQYTLTLLATQADKLAPALRQYLTGRLLPALYPALEKRKWPMVPYVEFSGRTPESGLQGFNDSPRYSTGYAALFNTLGLITETHMLKAFGPRVLATYAFLDEALRFVARDGGALAAARAEADRQAAAQTEFPLAWALDEQAPTETLQFRGYEARTELSAVSGRPRLRYDRAAPFTRPVPYYNTFRATLTARRPIAYLIPQAWTEVIERLRLSGVQLRTLARDTTLPVEARYLDDVQTSPRPYEGHYVHSQVKVRVVPNQPRAFRRGDFVALLDAAQPATRYLIEVLEPEAPDSFFAWGFFDSILQQKEYFSDYVFEDVAAGMLRRDPALQQELLAQQRADTAFARNGAAQLDFVYRRSPHYEPSHRRYPVVRWWGGALPVATEQPTR